jgi:hypothetical protein
MELTTLLFEKAGKHNTDATLEISKQRALDLGIRQVVVASAYGYTARKAHEVFSPEGIEVVVVYINHSMEVKGWTMNREVKAELEALGLTVYTGIHALGGGVESAFVDKHGGCSQSQVVRETLYRFSQGMKVAVECLLMAADAGLVDMEQEVISIAGTSRGADTSVVCWPAYARCFHDLEIREVLAKPRIPEVL